MGAKLETLAVILLFIVLIVGFAAFVYIFAINSGRVDISLPGNILGASDEAEELNYNFEQPEEVTYEKQPLIDESIEERISSSKSGSDYPLIIEPIGLDTTISQSNDIETLKSEGIMLLPWTYNFHNNWIERTIMRKSQHRDEAIIICYRNFYGPNHEKSCYDIDELEEGDVIKFNGNDYSVLSKVLIPHNSNNIFNPNPDKNYLKIITNSGENYNPDGNSHYLVIVAERADS